VISYFITNISWYKTEFSLAFTALNSSYSKNFIEIQFKNVKYQFLKNILLPKIPLITATSIPIFVLEWEMQEPEK